MSLSTKMLMFKTFVVPALTYAGPETWLPRHDLLQRVRTSFNSMLRRITHRPRGPEGISNSELYQLAGTSDVALQLEDRRLRRLGHVARRSDSALVKQLTFADGFLDVGRPAGRPRAVWFDGAMRTLDRLGLRGSWLSQAVNREAWGRVCSSVYAD